MHNIRQLLILVLVFQIALPARSDSGEIVGTIVGGQAATLRSEATATGSTVFSGDSVFVGNGGRAQIAVNGGGQIVLLSDSTARLMRTDATVDLRLERGTASFSAETINGLDAVLEDTVIRPSTVPAFAVIYVESATSIVVAAQKGSLEIATAHNSTVTKLHEKQAARITLVDDLPGARPAKAKPGKSLDPPQSHRLAYIALIIGGAAIITGGILSALEPRQSQQTLDNETSPFQLNH